LLQLPCKDLTIGDFVEFLYVFYIEVRTFGTHCCGDSFFVTVTQLEGTQAFGINSLVNDALQSINVHWCHSRPSGTTFGGHGFLSSVAAQIQQAFEIAFFQAHDMPNPSKLLPSKQKKAVGKMKLKGSA
jgi:hypothetical protein